MHSLCAQRPSASSHTLLVQVATADGSHLHAEPIALHQTLGNSLFPTINMTATRNAGGRGGGDTLGLGLGPVLDYRKRGSFLAPAGSDLLAATSRNGTDKEQQKRNEKNNAHMKNSEKTLTIEKVLSKVKRGQSAGKADFSGACVTRREGTSLLFFDWKLN